MSDLNLDIPSDFRNNHLIAVITQLGLGRYVFIQQIIGV